MIVKFKDDWDIDFIRCNPILSSEEDGEGDVGVITRSRVKRPRKYVVMLHNDDYTTMEFVIFILKSVFGKSQEEAMGVMLKVHNDGQGVCGVYTFEIAETKMKKVVQEAKTNGHPLLCTIEPE